jgi:uncharacterized protein (TIGR02594 family)
MPNFLKGYQMPRHMQIAFSLIGTNEIKGAKHNATILQWAKDLGLGKIYTNDEIAWCGLFFAHVMKEAGRRVDLNTKDAYDYLRAAKYVGMNGAEIIDAKDAAFGDVLIFQRPGGGHIGFYVSESENFYNVLGGNQSNSVNLTNIHKNRLTNCLRPNYISHRPQKFTAAVVGKVSTNEA